MTKILSHILFFAIMLIAGTGCLKDKGFENNKYGINNPDGQPKGVGFPQAKNSINPRGINFVNTAQVIPDLVVSLFATDPAPTDLHVNIVANNGLFREKKISTKPVAHLRIWCKRSVRLIGAVPRKASLFVMQ